MSTMMYCGIISFLCCIGHLKYESKILCEFSNKGLQHGNKTGTGMSLGRTRVRLYSIVLRLSRNANMHRAESLVSFLRKHDVIKIGPKQKGNVLRVVQPTMLQRSVCMLFNAQ